MVLLIMSAHSLHAKQTTDQMVDLRKQIERIGESANGMIDQVRNSIIRTESQNKIVKKITSKVKGHRTAKELLDELGLDTTLTQLGWTTQTQIKKGHKTDPSLVVEHVQSKNEEDNQSSQYMNSPNKTPISAIAHGTGLQGPNDAFALNEAHSVPALLLLWVALFMYGMGRNVTNSNSLAIGVRPRNPGELVKESFQTSGSSFTSKTPDHGNESNPATMVSCLAGNFAMGFAVILFFAAVFFARPSRAKVMAMAAVQALTGITITEYLARSDTQEVDYNDVQPSEAVTIQRDQ